MKHTRTGLVAFVSALVLVAVEPAAAQSINSDLISNLNFRLLYVAIPITLLVEVILVYTVYRFRDNDDPTPTQENRRLEITWTVATAIILLFVGLAAFTVLGNPYISLTENSVPNVASAQENSNATNTTPQVVDGNLSGAIAPPASSDAVEIDVLAYQWGWTFTYPEQGFNTSEQIVVPTDRDVYLHIHSRNVLHAFHVPKLGLKQDAFPGQYHTIVTNVTKAGSYQLYCAEYCGSGHSSMLANFTAMNDSGYENWVGQQSPRSEGGNASGSGNTSASGNETSPGNASGSNGTTSAATTGSQRLAPPATPVSVAT